MDTHGGPLTAVVAAGGLPRLGAQRRLLRRRRVERLAREQDGVMSRRQLYACGVTRGEIRANVRADRWQRVGSQSICIHRGPLGGTALLWAAVFEGGPRAYLDGGSALLAAGLSGYVLDRVRVSVPRGSRVRRSRRFDIRQTRRWSADDLVDDGVERGDGGDRAARGDPARGGPPRARVEVAAVRAALWARSNREAALVLSMVVQQRLCTPEALGLELLRVRRDRRRLFVQGVLLDLMGGVRSLGELDVARECRRRGLPEPSRQVLRRGRNGRYYLDVYWEQWRLVVEVDGIQHALAGQVVGDAIRQNDLALQGLTVLRLPLLGLRVAPEDFFAQIEDALARAGCVIPGRRTA